MNNQQIIESILAKLERRIKLNVASSNQPQSPINESDVDSLIDAIIRLEKQTQSRTYPPQMLPFAWEQR